LIKIFTISAMLLVGTTSLPIGSQTGLHWSWGKHKKTTPKPAPSSSSDDISVDTMNRTIKIHVYLEKKATDLKADLVTYPALRVQIQSLLDEIAELDSLPIDSPGYAEKFDAMHTSLLWLWKMEDYIQS
jgi:hypothetical protein